MVGLFKKRILPIGVDLGSSYLKMAQLGFNGRSLYLHAAGYRTKPDDINRGSSEWQRWAAKVVRETIDSDGFKGKEVMTALPSDDIFIDQVKISRSSSKQFEEAAFARVSQKLPFDPAGAMVKYVEIEHQSGADEIDVLVMAAESRIVARYLAIYEQAGLGLKGMGVWPIAMTNSYVQFFGRRSTDVNTVAMLIDIGTNHSNVAICKYSNLLFARVIPTGHSQLDTSEVLDRLVNEIDACCRYFESIYGGGNIGRLILFLGQNADENICKKMTEFAQHRQIPAQIGDVLAAVEPTEGVALDRRSSKFDWATAFGLSLTGWKD